MESRRLKAGPWAKKAGFSRGNALYNYLRGGSDSLSQGTLEALAKAAGVAIEEMFLLPSAKQGDREGSKQPPSALPLLREMPIDVPVMGTAACSVSGAFNVSKEVVEHFPRPPTLLGASNAYGVWVIGDSMSPAFEHGDPAYVNPARPPVVGDYVLLQVRNGFGDEMATYLKRLVEWRNEWVVVEQFNPRMKYEFKISQVERVHRVYRPAELLKV